MTVMLNLTAEFAGIVQNVYFFKRNESSDGGTVSKKSDGAYNGRIHQ